MNKIKLFIQSQILIIIMAVINISLLPLISYGLKVPDSPEARVSDWAGIMSEDAKSRLEEILGDFEEKTGNQIAVATFTTLEGDSLEDFSIRLAEKWKIGQKGKDSGIILLIIKDDRLVRIEVGYGLEGVIPDAVASQIIRGVIVPSFQKGDFDGGITLAVQTMIRIISGENSAIPEENKIRSGSMAYLLNIRAIKTTIIVIFILIVLLFIIDIFRYGGYVSENRNYGHRYGFIEWMIYFGILLAIMKLILQMIFFSRGFGGGRGGFGSSGGGFSGGGGNFGGGGASGSW